jgi:arylsulfatase A-like enzyme
MKFTCLFMSDNGGNAEAGPEGRSNGDPTRALSNWFCGESWAFLQNTPLRLYKHYNHEGGIATPMIAHWPSGIAAKNELRTQPAHLIDIMATCVDVAGTAPLSELHGKPLTPLEGRSLVPAFNNQPVERDGLFWEHEGNAAVRDGDWKLVRKGRDGDWELYDLAKDRTEQNNLASEQPAQAQKLAAMWQDWATRAKVKPDPNESKRKGKRKASKS